MRDSAEADGGNRKTVFLPSTNPILQYCLPAADMWQA